MVATNGISARIAPANDNYHLTTHLTFVTHDATTIVKHTVCIATQSLWHHHTTNMVPYSAVQSAPTWRHSHNTDNTDNTCECIVVTHNL